MPIQYFGDSPEINVRTPDELIEAVDLLHTQVLDHFPDSIAAPYLTALSETVERLHAVRAKHPMPARKTLRERVEARRATAPEAGPG